MKLLFLLVLLTVQAFSQIAVYPLDIGDRWDYAYIDYYGSDTMHFTYEITNDTSFANNVTYAMLLEMGSDPAYAEFVRQQGDSVFIYSTVYHKEHLFFHFSGKEGDTVSTFIQGGDTTDVVLTFFYTSNSFGALRRIWTFYINDRSMTDDEYFLTIADSIGIISRQQMMGPSYDIKGALIQGRVYGTISGIKNNHKSQPLTFQVLQNYPNPFNPSTTIQIQLYQCSDVGFEVLDVLGRCVQKELYPKMSVGKYSLHFDGSRLSSGVYYYRVITNEGNHINKMVLLK